jgi:hypothetical protein
VAIERPHDGDQMPNQAREAAAASPSAAQGVAATAAAPAAGSPDSGATTVADPAQSPTASPLSAHPAGTASSPTHQSTVPASAPGGDGTTIQPGSNTRDSHAAASDQQSGPPQQQPSPQQQQPVQQQPIQQQPQHDGGAQHAPGSETTHPTGSEPPPPPSGGQYRRPDGGSQTSGYGAAPRLPDPGDLDYADAGDMTGALTPRH